ncbi:unnamed protein product [Tetraodon nigroviridis]|uniref:(spotted green pufferfish) hypothetical protein n=1 Tax=Tetraodon nigroviridis TaxID=99883 RepID=Q4RVA0_TETNG|nr:unnamed protein product [Tetraodon nigroviridis]
MKHKGDVDDCSTVTSRRILLLYSIPPLFSCGLSLIGTGSRVIDVSAEVEPTPLTCENESQCQKGRLDQERWSSAGHWGADMACLKKRLSIQNKTQRETTATRQLAAH